ncbi:MAG: alpha/beta hydrolase-fold protein [Actinomycetaceae bacterium]|nr:alpha/beta hydrolase-fold protein [Actinomycetaceae bacterium]
MFGPDRLLTLVVFAAATIAALVWAVRAIGRATSRRRILRAATAMTVAVVCALATTGIQMNRNLGYVNSWGDVPELVDSAYGSGPVRAKPDAVPKREGNDPVLDAHEGEAAWKATFKRDSNGAMKTVFKGPVSKIEDLVWVSVPKGYAPDDGKTYRVVLMLHGYPGNPKKVPSQLDLAAMAKAHPDTIFAIPSLKVRHVYGDCADIEGRPPIATWVLQDIVGMVRHNFPNTAPTREGWTIAGASFGGYCSSVLGLTNPHIFSRIIAFSGYDKPSTGRLVAAEQTIKRLFTVSHLLRQQRQWPQRYYATGTAHDGKSKEFLESLKSVKSDTVKLTTVLEPSGGHNWGVWRKQLPAALTWNEAK